MNLTESFWDKTYRDNIGKMIGICYRYVLNRQVAEDLAQDAFIIAMEKSAGYKGKGPFEAWLKRIVVNSALQYLRKQRADKYFEDWMQNEEILMNAYDDNRQSLSDKFDFSHEELLEVINGLPEHHRLVFNMYVIDRLTHAQIAEELGISQGTSKSHLSRARKKIQQLLNRKAGEKYPEERRRRAWLLLIFPRRHGIDRLFSRRFSDFEIRSVRNMSFTSRELNAIPKSFISKGVFSVRYILTAGISIAIISVVIILRQNGATPQNVPDRIHIPVVDSTVSKKSAEDTTRISTEYPNQEETEEIKDSTQKKKPVVVRKTIVKHQTVVVRDTVKIMGNANEE